jgi:hypothetical protein
MWLLSSSSGSSCCSLCHHTVQGLLLPSGQLASLSLRLAQLLALLLLLLSLLPVSWCCHIQHTF